MSEHYEIIGQARGEPRAAGCVGVRVRVQLSGCPSRRWSQALGGRLATELAGHAAVGHLRINITEIVQGDEIVLEASSQARRQHSPNRFSVQLMPRTRRRQASRIGSGT